jgi:hypothetical protein
MAVAGKDRHAIAILVLAGQRERRFEIGRTHDLQDRPKISFL